MVLITATNASALRTNFDFGRLTGADAAVVEQRGTSLIIDVGGLRYAFNGSGLLYGGNGEATAGTFTGLNILSDGNLIFQADGFSVSATSVYQASHASANVLTALVLAGDDELRGGDRDDNFSDLAGHNVLRGGAGADTIVAGDGNDHIYGQSPNGGADGGDSISAGGGADYINGNAGNDTINGGAGSDRIQGGADADNISGDTGNDTVNGNLGADSINGGDGNDSLRGGQGNDTIDGGAGNDTVLGDTGLDELRGGAGNDLFLFSAGVSPINVRPDRIVDFQSGEDHLSVGFLPEALLEGNADPFAGATGSFISAGQSLAQLLIDQRAGGHEVAMIRVISQTYFFWDSDGNGSIDSVIDVSNTGSHSLSDFIIL